MKQYRAVRAVQRKCGMVPSRIRAHLIGQMSTRQQETASKIKRERVTRDKVWIKKKLEQGEKKKTKKKRRKQQVEGPVVFGAALATLRHGHSHPEKCTAKDAKSPKTQASMLLFNPSTHDNQRDGSFYFGLKTHKGKCARRAGHCNCNECCTAPCGLALAAVSRKKQRTKHGCGKPTSADLAIPPRAMRNNKAGWAFSHLSSLTSRRVKK